MSATTCRARSVSPRRATARGRRTARRRRPSRPAPAAGRTGDELVAGGALELRRDLVEGRRASRRSTNTRTSAALRRCASSKRSELRYRQRKQLSRALLPADGGGVRWFFFDAYHARWMEQPRLRLAGASLLRWSPRALPCGCHARCGMPGLSSPIFALRQTTMRSRSGMNSPHSRITSGVQQLGGVVRLRRHGPATAVSNAQTRRACGREQRDRVSRVIRICASIFRRDRQFLGREQRDHACSPCR